MTEPYTPPEAEVVNAATHSYAGRRLVRPEFYRWLAAHDAQVRAEARREGAVEALREAADALSLTPSKWPWHVLRARADRIAAEG